MAKEWTASQRFKCTYDVEWTDSEAKGTTKNEAVNELHLYQAYYCGGLDSDVKTRDQLFLESRDVPDPPPTHRIECLDANDGNGSPYLHETPNRANPNHLWRYVQVGEHYMILSQRNAAALDADNGVPGVYLHLNPDPENDNHLWELRRAGSAYLIISKRTASALDADGGGVVYLNANVDENNDNQRWFLRPPFPSFILCQFKLH